MEILLIAMVMSSIVTKWVQDGRTDRSYAAKGMVSPRYQERLARLEKAGRPNTRSVAPERGPLRSYLAEVRDDAVLDLGTWLTDRHRKKREARGPVSFDPAAPTWRQRFTAGMLAEIDDYKRKANWSRPEPEPDVPEPDPVEYEPGTVTFDEHGQQVPLAPESHDSDDPRYVSGLETKLPKLGQRYGDMEWVGDVWAPVCPRCDKPMGGRDRLGWLICDVCGLRAADRNNVTDNRETNVNVARTMAVYEDEGYNIAAARGATGPYGKADMVRLRAEMYGKCGQRPGPGEAADGAGFCPAYVCDHPRHGGGPDNAYCCYHTLGGRPSCLTCQGTGIAEEGACPACGTPEERRLADLDHQSTNATTGGTTMTGEAVNYETATVALGELTAATQNLADHVSGAVADAESFRTHVEEVDEAKRSVQIALTSVQEQLGAKGVDATTQARINEALELINANDLTAALEHIDGAKNALDNAQAGANDAATAAGSANESLDETYGDIDERMRAHGTHGSFVGATA